MKVRCIFLFRHHQTLMDGVTLMVMKIWSDDWMVITLEKAQIFSPEFLNSPGSHEQSTSSGVGELVVDELLDEVGFWISE